MSTTPAITTVVQSEVSALAHRHMTFTYGLVGTIILMMVLMAFGGYMAIKHFDAQLARQDAKDAQYQQDRTQWQAQMVQHDKERVQQAQEIAQLQAQIAHRDSQPLPKPIQEGLKSDATLPEVELGL